MSHLLKVRVVLAALLALTTFAAAGTRAFADQSNTATVFLKASGGNATAIATCVNQAGGGDNGQFNICTNTAIAIGGNVVLTNVKIVNVVTV